jgi:hypothetical protein
MKNGLFIGALGIALVGGMMTGDAQAASSAAGAASEPGFIDSYQAQSAMETGALPEAHEGRLQSGGNPSNEPVVPFVEIGGVKYRLGLDTGA